MATARKGRLTIGLYNTYDPVRFAEAHRRALARAGALAHAFDCNLATFGFPYPPELSTPTEIASWVATTTSIGEAGSYLVALAQASRFMVFPFPDGGFPPQLGAPVITTPTPAKERATTPPAVAGRLGAGESILLIFGLGHRGLPRELLSATYPQLDVSGKGAALETATALGAVVGGISLLRPRKGG